MQVLFLIKINSNEKDNDLLLRGLGNHSRKIDDGSAAGDYGLKGNRYALTDYFF
jgi:hypothetical protein